MNNVVLNFNNDLLDNITNIYKRLQNLNSNTQEYVAKKTKSGTDVKNQLKAISTDYAKMGEEYTNVAKEYGDKLEENKQKTLDKLIEEVILESILEGK